MAARANRLSSIIALTELATVPMSDGFEIEPVISGSRRHRNVYYAFGHGHLGLTQSAATGHLVAQLLADQSPSIALEPFRPDRFRW